MVGTIGLTSVDKITPEELLYILKNAPVMKEGYFRAAFRHKGAQNNVIEGFRAEIELLPDDIKLCDFAVHKPEVGPPSIDKKEFKAIYQGAKPSIIRFSTPYFNDLRHVWKNTEAAFCTFQNQLDPLVQEGYLPSKIELGYYRADMDRGCLPPVSYGGYRSSAGIVVVNYDEDNARLPRDVLFYLNAGGSFMDNPETEALEAIVKRLQSKRE